MVKVAKKAKANNNPSRKDIKQPDQFVEVSTKSAEWFTEYKGAIIALCVGAFLVSLAVYSFYHYKGQQQKNATEELGKALEIFNAEISKKPSTDDKQKTYKTKKEKYTAALKAFEALQKNFKQTRTGSLATLYIAHSYQNLGQCDKAIPHYKKFTESLPSADPLHYLGVNAMAYCLESQGKDKEGLKLLDAAYEKGSKHSKAFALLRLAEYYLHKGNTKQARKYYEKLAKDKSTYQAEAKKRLAVLP